MNELDKIFEGAKNNIGKALDSDMAGEYDMNDIYVLIKDLAHTGGNRKTPISIMRKNSLFYKQKDSGYYSDGFHLISGHVCKDATDYFQKLIIN